MTAKNAATTILSGVQREIEVVVQTCDASFPLLAGALGPLSVHADASVRALAAPALKALPKLKLAAHVASQAAVPLKDIDTLLDSVRAEAQEDMAQVNSDLAQALDEVRKSSAFNSIRLRRPQSALLRHAEDADSDILHCRNAADSVRSRIRFIYDSEGSAVGVAALLSEDPSNGMKYHVVHFDDHIPMADRVLQRQLDVDGSSDGVFVYRSAVQLAVSIADSIVSIYGPLDSMYVSTGSLEESLATPHDSLGGIDDVGGLDDDDDLEAAVDLALRESGVDDGSPSLGDLGDIDLGGDFDVPLASSERQPSDAGDDDEDVRIPGLGETVLIADADPDSEGSSTLDLEGDGLGSFVLGDFEGVAGVDASLASDGEASSEVLLPEGESGLEGDDDRDPFADLGDASADDGSLAEALADAGGSDSLQESPEGNDGAQPDARDGDDDAPAETFEEATSGTPEADTGDDDAPAETFEEATGERP